MCGCNRDWTARWCSVQLVDGVEVEVSIEAKREESGKRTLKLCGRTRKLALASSLHSFRGGRVLRGDPNRFRGRLFKSSDASQETLKGREATE